MPERQGPSLPAAQSQPATEIAAFLRSLGDLPALDGEAATDVKRPAPRAVDVAAWIGWALAGLYACALPRRKVDDQGNRPWAPPIRVMVREARRVAIVIAMHRHDGNLTQAADALGTSRRALRDALKDAGLYPWSGASKGDDDESPDDDASIPVPEDPT